MPIDFLCPSCDQNLQVPEKAAGRVIRCPHCQQGVAVPAAPGFTIGDLTAEQTTMAIGGGAGALVLLVLVVFFGGFLGGGGESAAEVAEEETTDEPKRTRPPVKRVEIPDAPAKGTEKPTETKEPEVTEEVAEARKRLRDPVERAAYAAQKVTEHEIEAEWLRATLDALKGRDPERSRYLLELPLRQLSAELIQRSPFWRAIEASVPDDQPLIAKATILVALERDELIRKKLEDYGHVLQLCGWLLKDHAKELTERTRQRFISVITKTIDSDSRHSLQLSGALYGAWVIGEEFTELERVVLLSRFKEPVNVRAKRVVLDAGSKHAGLQVKLTGVVGDPWILEEIRSKYGDKELGPEVQLALKTIVNKATKGAFNVKLLAAELLVRAKNVDEQPEEVVTLLTKAAQINQDWAVKLLPRTNVADDVLDRIIIKYVPPGTSPERYKVGASVLRATPDRDHSVILKELIERARTKQLASLDLVQELPWSEDLMQLMIESLDSPTLRDQARRAIYMDDRSAPYLYKRLDVGPPDTRFNVLLALAGCKHSLGRKATPRLKKALKDRYRRGQARLGLMLGACRRGDRRMMWVALDDAFADNTLQGQAFVMAFDKPIRELARLPETAVLKATCSQLNRSKDLKKRLMAAVVNFHLGLESRLLGQLNDKDETVWRTALKYYLRIGGEEAMSKALRYRREHIRKAALAMDPALAQRADARRTRVVINELLRSDKAEKRADGISKLNSLSLDDSKVQLLCRWVSEAKDAETTQALATSLAGIWNAKRGKYQPQIRLAAVGISYKGDAAKRIAATTIAQAMGSRGRSILFRLSEDKDETVAQAAEDALAAQ